MNRATIVKAAILFTSLQAMPALAARPSKASTQPVSAEDKEKAYAQTLDKRANDVIDALNLDDPAKAGRVHDEVIAQYRAINDWHNANDVKLKALTAQKNDLDAQSQAAEIKKSLQILHDSYLAALAKDLTSDQVDIVKDKMTYGTVKVTYNAYCQIVPNLTDTDKAKILDYLKAAREEAMDCGTADEKHAAFKRAKGKINNYLAQHGHDVNQAYKDFGDGQRSTTHASAATQEMP